MEIKKEKEKYSFITGLMVYFVKLNIFFFLEFDFMLVFISPHLFFFFFAFLKLPYLFSGWKYKKMSYSRYPSRLKRYLLLKKYKYLLLNKKLFSKALKKKFYKKPLIKRYNNHACYYVGSRFYAYLGNPFYFQQIKEKKILLWVWV